MKTERVFEIFYFFSKIILIMPIVIIILALILKYRHPQKKINPVFPTITPTLKSLPSPAKKEIKIDFNSSFICQGEIEEASISAFIKNKKIRIITKDKKKIENSLIIEDCYYHWQEDQFSGERICGLSHFFSLVEAVISFSSLPINDFLQQLSKFGFKENLDIKESAILDFIKSCQKKQIIDDKLFQLPKNILFKNKN